MILWFAGLAFVIVVAVFRDAAIDYRLVMAGALLPDAIDVLPVGDGVAHTLLFSVTLLAAVMLTTRRRRAARRRLLALPIGTFVHLVLDGAWTRAHLFWWPFLGDPARFRLPSMERGAAVVIVQEIIGAGALVWCFRRFELRRRDNRTRFVREGRLARELVG